MRPVMRDRGELLAVDKINKYITGFYRGTQDEDGIVHAGGNPLGIAVGLSVMGNLRGWSAEDYTIMIMDEFIPEKHEHPLRNEATAFFNAYETINRNRELQGLPALKALFLSNANDLTNDYFLTLNLINKADSMKVNKEDEYHDPARSLSIYMPHDSPISEAKKQTALYKLTEGTPYSHMALDNDFVDEDRGTISSRSLREYVSIVKVGELVIYKHKSLSQFYACLHLTGTCPEYGITEIELKRFTSNYIYLWSAYLANNIIFETYTCEALFRKYFK